MGETILIIAMAILIFAGILLAIKIDGGGNSNKDEKEHKRQGEEK